MNDEPKTPHANPKLIRRTQLIAAGILVLAVAMALIVNQVMTPKRSVAEYCKVYKVEKVRLAKLPGDTYPSLLFDHPLGDAGEFVSSLNRLEVVAPRDVSSEVTSLEQLYLKLKKDPSQLVSVSLAAEPIDKSLAEWTTNHCQ